MPEYGYSTAYRGMNGVALPPGALEAMTAPGRNIGRGIEKIGEGVASMIQRYQQTKAERDLASGELEGLIAQYIPQAQALPSGETGGVDLGQFGKIVGEKNVKKFVEGKASTSDMLAMAHSIKTAQAEKDRALNNEVKRLQIDEYKRQQQKDIEAINQGQIATDVARYAMGLPESTTREVQTTSMQQPVVQPSPVVFPAGATTPELPPHLRLLSTQTAKPAEQIAAEMAPRQVTATNTVTEPMGYEAKRKMLADYALKTGAKPEIFAALDNLLAMAGNKRPMQIGVQQLPGNLGSVVTAGDKVEFVKPDVTAQARMVQGFQGVAPTEKEAIDFRQLQSDTAASKDLIDELLALSTTPGATVQPELRAKGKSLSQQLVGKIRTSVLGPGTVTDSEREILESLAANPATIFSLDSKTRASLQTLKSSLDRSVSEKAKSLGLVGQTQTQGGLPRFKLNPATLK